MRHRKQNQKEKAPIVSVQLTIPLVQVIDSEAQRMGFSRSDIIRRTLLDAYRHRLPVDDAAVEISA